MALIDPQRRASQILAEMLAWGIEVTPQLAQTVHRYYRDQADRHNEWEALLDPTEHEPIVYYARQGDLVRIGCSTSIRKLLDRHPQFELLALTYAGEDRERMTHLRFRHLRTSDRDPWFHYREPLIGHIHQVQAEHEQYEQENSGRPILDDNQWLTAENIAVQQDVTVDSVYKRARREQWISKPLDDGGHRKAFWADNANASYRKKRVA